jgi:hypothetical protein
VVALRTGTFLRAGAILVLVGKAIFTNERLDALGHLLSLPDTSMRFQ